MISFQGTIPRHPLSESPPPLLSHPPAHGRLKTRLYSQASNTSEKLRVSATNAAYNLQLDASRQGQLAALADGGEHSDDDDDVWDGESQWSYPPGAGVGAGAGAGVGGDGGRDDALASESPAAMRRRSLDAQLARYVGMTMLVARSSWLLWCRQDINRCTLISAR